MFDVDDLGLLIQIMTALSPIIVGILVYITTRRKNNIEEKKAENDQIEDNWQIGKDLRDEIRADLETARHQIELLSQKVEEYRKVNTKLRSTLSDMKIQWRDFEMKMLAKLEAVESNHNDLPIPYWVKDDTGRMVFCNMAYERYFLEPMGLTRNDYIRKYDHDVWPKEIADGFKEHDDAVLAERKPWIGEEAVSMASGEVILFDILKYPKIIDDIVVGVAGLAFPRDNKDLLRFFD